MIYHDKPADFKPKFDVVSCFLTCENDVLFLRRVKDKPQGNTWGIPAGKIENDESRESAVVREIFEETGIEIGVNELKFYKTLFVRYPTYDFNYHIYSAARKERDFVKTDPISHSEARWLTPDKALELDLIQDEDHCIKLFFNFERK